MKYKILSLTISLLLMILCFTTVMTFANFKLGYPTKDIEVTPAGLAKGKQTIKVKVKGQAFPLPKTVWTQTDTEIWKATSSK
ncbi:hypothetical protein [Paenibacillus silvae]|uniref:hypothetical protein n=1 Tax=Paenibacillus silvae TaxID=1325358 RepID=UPI002005D171|nr:hypothetical protein [Paenibacillus silvae]MCK6075980.1 hypothetical protein [Paenibacillus silvae]MCK6150369.1 hypothetical protein [Paenibacillus silvae]MCK6268667.1 hypothetical protein [Paenibacillus silvae]